VRKELVCLLDYDITGKSVQLELVHSDVYGKMGTKTIGAEYFLTLLDDKLHYTWVYLFKTKDQSLSASSSDKQTSQSRE